MSQNITRTIVRWIHIVFAVPILGYIYSPFEKLPDYAPKTRFVFVPVMVLSGLWMWKGHVGAETGLEKVDCANFGITRRLQQEGSRYERRERKKRVVTRATRRTAQNFESPL